jgi:tetratricopeptide (TPR) repeat protein
MINKS